MYTVISRSKLQQGTDIRDFLIFFNFFYENIVGNGGNHEGLYDDWLPQPEYSRFRDGMCVCVCVCVYMHTYIYIYIYIHTHTHTHTHTYMHVFVYIYVCMYVYVYVCIYMYIYIHTGRYYGHGELTVYNRSHIKWTWLPNPSQVRKLGYICIYIYIYICVCIYMCMYMYMYGCICVHAHSFCISIDLYRFGHIDVYSVLNKHKYICV
jgi:hypothetical protein